MYSFIITNAVMPLIERCAYLYERGTGASHEEARIGAEDFAISAQAAVGTVTAIATADVIGGALILTGAAAREGLSSIKKGEK